MLRGEALLDLDYRVWLVFGDELLAVGGGVFVVGDFVSLPALVDQPGHIGLVLEHLLVRDQVCEAKLVDSREGHFPGLVVLLLHENRRNWQFLISGTHCLVDLEWL